MSGMSHVDMSQPGIAWSIRSLIGDTMPSLYGLVARCHHITCWSMAGFQLGSKRMRRAAPTRLSPVPPALDERRGRASVRVRVIEGWLGLALVLVLG